MSNFPVLGLDDLPEAACRRMIAALLLQALKDRIGSDLQTQHDAIVFIASPQAADYAAMIDLPWPPTDAMVTRFATDPTLYLPAFIMADGRD